MRLLECATQPRIIILSILIMCVTIPFIIGMSTFVYTMSRQKSLHCDCHKNIIKALTTDVAVHAVFRKIRIISKIMNFTVVASVNRQIWIDSIEPEYKCLGVLVGPDVVLTVSGCAPLKDRTNYTVRFGSNYWWFGGLVNPIISVTPLKFKSKAGKLESLGIDAVKVKFPENFFNEYALLAGDIGFDETYKWGRLFDVGANTGRPFFDRHMMWTITEQGRHAMEIDVKCKSVPKSVYGGSHERGFCAKFDDPKVAVCNEDVNNDVLSMPLMSDMSLLGIVTLYKCENNHGYVVLRKIARKDLKDSNVI